MRVERGQSAGPDQDQARQRLEHVADQAAGDGDRPGRPAWQAGRFAPVGRAVGQLALVQAVELARRATG